MTLPYPPLPRGDFGFGSAYERYALYHWLERWLGQSDRPLQTGVEGFYDSFAGLPGLHLLPIAMAGGKVTVACQNENSTEQVCTVYRDAGLADRLETLVATTPESLAGRKFDVAMLFNPFPFVEDWRELLDTTAQLSSRYLIISVCSRNSYGIVFRRVLQKIRPSSGTGLNLFEHPTSDPVFMRNLLASYGKIVREDYFDAPWWPDFYGGPGDTVLTWMLRQVGWKPRAKPVESSPEPPTGNHFYAPENFPYFQRNSPDWQGLEKKIARHPSFDHRPRGWVKALFAHHRIFVVQRPPVE